MTVGESDGVTVGEVVGDSDGAGLAVGQVPPDVGESVTAFGGGLPEPELDSVGESVAVSVGLSVGVPVGKLVGFNVGEVVGDAVPPPGIVGAGLAVGKVPPDVGATVGGAAAVTSTLPLAVADGASEGVWAFTTPNRVLLQDKAATARTA